MEWLHKMWYSHIEEHYAAIIKNKPELNLLRGKDESKIRSSKTKLEAQNWLHFNGKHANT